MRFLYCFSLVLVAIAGLLIFNTYIREPRVWSHSYELLDSGTIVLTNEPDIERVRSNLARNLGVEPDTLQLKAKP
jgi:hypothetical protein